METRETTSLDEARRTAARIGVPCPIDKPAAAGDDDGGLRKSRSEHY